MDPERGYAQFLDTFDAGTWVATLQDYARALDEPSKSTRLSSESLRRGLCISIFAQWLGWLAGQNATADSARELFAQFAAAIRERHRQAPSPETKTGIGVLLSNQGYSQAGARLLGEGALAQPEIALLFEPNGLARKTAFLRSFVFDGRGQAFRPALFRYCDALLGLGAIGEVRKLIAERGGDTRDGVFADIVGRLHEQAGEWQEALEVYRQSPWPRHTYRATVCDRILHGAASAGTPGEQPSTDADTATRREMSIFQAEIDQAELSRATAFVNACQWNPVRDWLIHFELGKLSFRQRRHCEAEANLARAVAAAPPGHRFPILSLRFTNLTWLTGESLSRELPMKPEALACGRAALACKADAQEDTDDDQFAQIGVWLAGETEEKELLQHALESQAPQVSALAHELSGNPAKAIDILLQSLEKAYSHRALQRLVSICYSCELEHAALFVADVMIEESWDDFFVLWEIGTLLLRAASSSHETSAAGRRLGEQLERVMRRLEELGRFDFQNLLRAHEFFTTAGHQEVAESLLNRAAKLADGAEENLTIAVLRRTVPRVGKGEVDSQGLACLQHAEEESRDRLERLQIARELFHYGQPQRARRILLEDGVLASPDHELARLSPIEAIVALSCHTWLRKEELARLAENAIENLGRELESGAIGRDAARFIRRLYVSIYTADEVLAARLRGSLDKLRERAAEIVAQTASVSMGGAGSATVAASRDARGRWSSWRTAVSKAAESGNTDEEDALLRAAVESAQDATVGFRIALWRYLFGEMKLNLAAAEKVRPQLPADRMPYAKSNQRLDLRAQELCDRWRALLIAGPGADGARARHSLNEFYAEEQKLLEEWEASRRQASSVSLRRARSHARLAGQVLALMIADPAENDAAPLLAGFHEALALDVDALQKRVAARLHVMGEGPMPGQA